MKTSKSSPITRLAMVFMALVVLLGTMGAAAQPAAASPAAADDFALTVIAVEKGRNVTIKVSKMPANTEFRVRMNEIGTQGVDGVTAGTAKTGSDGTFTATFTIPATLREKSSIAIRIEATNGTGWYAYNWFYNQNRGTTPRGSNSGNTNSGGSGGTGSSAPQGGFSAGNISITDVDEDLSVAIEASKAPANTLLTVWMDWKNRQGNIVGVQAGSVRSNASGVVDATVKMSVAVQDRRELRIRLQGSGYQAYAWFLNTSSDGNVGSGAPSSYSGGIPYILVTAVDEGDTVTIEAFNFPSGDYKVLMGKYGSQGKNGIKVDTVKIKKGVTFTETFELPKDLENRSKVAIRIQGDDDSSFYAFTWFDND